MSSRLAVDIGGTFTDVVLETAGRAHSIKLLTVTNSRKESEMEGRELSPLVATRMKNY